MSIPYPSTVSSLPKFGISNTGDTGQGPIRMPKVKYRFRVLFLNFGNSTDHGQALTLNTDTCGLPKLSWESQSIHSYNSRVYFPGKHEFGELNLTVRNVVDNSVELAIGAQSQKQLDAYSQTGWRAAQDYKFTYIIQSLDGSHQATSVIDSWTCEGCFLQSVEWGDLSYAESGARTVNMVIRPDNCILENFGGTNSLWADPNKANPGGPNPQGNYTGS